MGRAAYLALAWPPGHTDARARAAALTSQLQSEGCWRFAGATDRSAVWVGGRAPPQVQALTCQAGFVIGQVFRARHRQADPSPLEDPAACPRNPLQIAERLCAVHWGCYVALLHGPPPATSAVFRDPSGHLDALIWPLGDSLEVIASDMLALPAWLRPRHLALNWDRIGRYLAIPSAATTEPLFDGIVSVGPGELLPLGKRPARPTLVWSPARFAGLGGPDVDLLGPDLIRRVDDCTSALTQGHDRLLVELSGGLDSSIVAAALSATGAAPRVGQWLNRVGDRREADESGYARSVTDQIGVELTTVLKPMTPLTSDDLAELGLTFFPAIAAADAGTDRDAVARLQSLGATAIVSGQGGDAVFFQMPSALIAADALQRDGLSALWSPLLPDVARRARMSVWQVLREARVALRNRTPPLMPPSGLTSRDVAAEATGAIHAWVVAAREAGVSPAKRLQIEALANCHIFHGESRRRREADLLYPLLAQPVVELCLSIGAPELAGGAYDRAFARRVFAERLPAAVRDRRAKGAMGSFFSHLVAQSLEVLRPHLLNGCLCDAGVLDRDQVDRALDPQSLIWRSQATEILWAATVEAWVRHWQGRVPDSDRAPRRRGFVDF